MHGLEGHHGLAPYAIEGRVVSVDEWAKHFSTIYAAVQIYW